MKGYRVSDRYVRALAALGVVIVVGCEQFDPTLSGQWPASGATAVSAPAPPHPPPISGGTLLMAKDGHTAIAADPDRDAVYVVDVAQAVPHVVTIQLAPGDEPGRAAQDAAGLVHVALRGGSAVADIDPAGLLLGKRQACPAPRGIAYDAGQDQLVVACAGGELVRLAASPTGPLLSTRFVAPDLRDVLFVGGQLFVTQFREATLLRLAADGTVEQTTQGYGGIAPDGTQDAPNVAWRAVAAGGSIAMVHQQAMREVVPPTPGAVGYYGSSAPSTAGYYGSATSTSLTGCGTAITQSTVTFFDGTGAALTQAPPLNSGVLPVDVALGPSGKLAVVLAGNAHSGLPTVVVLDAHAFAVSTNPCEPFAPPPTFDSGEPIAVAFDGAGRLVVQSREPAMLSFHGSSDTPIPLAGASREETGHAIFHGNSGGSLACASCHPEGGDDGHVWKLIEGTRRTQSLRGTIAGTAPYHWGGELAGLRDLIQEVYTVRMSGPSLGDDETDALSTFVSSLPPPKVTVPSDPSHAASVARGQALFESPAVGCTACHSGPELTNNATVDVGTGGAFQVPSLVGVSWRPPYLHDGCAPTLTARFDPTVTDPATGKPCGGTGHGNTSGLTSGQIADVIAYLETL
jgi:hypothetical protein